LGTKLYFPIPFAKAAANEIEREAVETVAPRLRRKHRPRHPPTPDLRSKALFSSIFRALFIAISGRA
jgi:hypothetical protein